jgi:hypothetical protein
MLILKFQCVTIPVISASRPHWGARWSMFRRYVNFGSLLILFAATAYLFLEVIVEVCPKGLLVLPDLENHYCHFWIDTNFTSMLCATHEHSQIFDK